MIQVRLTRKAISDLEKVPFFIKRNLQAWVKAVEFKGLSEVRKIPGYHDESLKGTRAGQRSVRLSRSYRAIYITSEDGTIEFVDILEVNKHDY